MVSAWVTLIAYFVMMVISYFLGQKYYPIPYRIGKIMIVFALLGLFTYLSVSVFDYNVWVGNAFFLILIVYIVVSNRLYAVNR